MRTTRIAFALAMALGCFLQERSAFAQSNETPLSPDTCRRRLEALQASFVFSPPVAEGDCTIPLPVRLRSLAVGSDSIAFGAEPVLDCRLAEQLADWIGNVVDPLARHHLGSRLASVETGPGYACRKRNNQAAGKLSEHAKGNALDIAAFALDDGRRIAVRPADTPEAAVTAFLVAVRTTACGYFLTVLGPGSDASHAEHLYLDLRGRAQTYRICE